MADRQDRWSRWMRAAGSQHSLLLLLAGVVVLALGIWTHGHRGLPWKLWSGDAQEYAEMGRRLAQGEGFTTGVIFPAELEFGATQDHPAVVRPPLWPIWLAGFFTVAGPRAGAVHAALALFYLATIAAATALAAKVAGRAAGAVAGVAVASCPQLLVLSMDGASETSFAFWITLTFLLCAHKAHPVWVGFTCGLAYLTRYNGALLLPFAILLSTRRTTLVRSTLWCITGFVAVALPWWIRNQLVAGNPFFSLLNWNLYVSPFGRRVGGSLFFLLEPDPSASVAMDPLEKARIQLPLLLRFWPVASANLSACLGIALACVKRDRLPLALLGVLAVTTLAVAFTLNLGRYFVPLLPVVLALGVAAWTRHGGWARIPALALLLAAPLLPAVPREAQDLGLFRILMERARGRAGADLQTEADATEALRSCLAGRPLLLAQGAARLTWETEAISIYAPGNPEDFWRIVDEYPVEYLQIAHWQRISRTDIEARFAPRPDCGPGIYERRREPDSDRQLTSKPRPR